MKTRQNKILHRLLGFGTLVSLWSLLCVPAMAQNDPSDFSFGEEGVRQRPIDNVKAKEITSDAPIRLARFTYIKGNVSWRTSDKEGWASASVNLPLRQGAQIWVEGKGRAELQFDDGSLLRLGNSALITLQILYSDTEGTFTEIKQHEGLATLRLRHKLAVYQIDTPFASVKAAGPARIRTGVGQSVEIAIQQGDATIEGSMGSYRVRENDYLLLESGESKIEARRIPRADGWDQWNLERDEELVEINRRPTQRNMPENVAFVAGDLDSYGSWRNDNDYGQVWCPRVVSTWRPYSDGRWVWVHPFGWTWVSYEPWGWAPYHYGTWVHRPFGWAWVPGPVTQCWSPAVVQFAYVDNCVIWTPLAPREVLYPRHCLYTRRMGSYFSLLYAGVYYQAGVNHCEARPYAVNYINHATFVNASTHYGHQRPVWTAADKLNFRPRNLDAGGSFVRARDFGGSGEYRQVTATVRNGYERARVVAHPRREDQPLSGPADAPPDTTAIVPNRIVQMERQPRMGSLDRPIYRAPIPNAVERTANLDTGLARAGANDRLNPTRRERLPIPPATLPNGRPSAPQDRFTTRPTVDLPRPAERTRPQEPITTTPRENPAQDAARRARDVINGRGERRTQPETPSRPDNPTTPNPERRNPSVDPPRAERPQEPRREPTIPSAPSRPEAPRREDPPRRDPSVPSRPVERPQEPRRETPREVPRQDPPRRENPAPAPEPRREAPRPIERPVERRPDPTPPPRYDPPPRRETPPPAPPRYDPPPRRESPPPAPPRQDPPSRTPDERGRRRP